MRLPTLRKGTCENRMTPGGISPTGSSAPGAFCERFLRRPHSLPSRRNVQAAALFPLHPFSEAVPDQALRSSSPLCPPSIMGTPICAPEGWA